MPGRERGPTEQPARNATVVQCQQAGGEGRPAAGLAGLPRRRARASGLSDPRDALMRRARTVHDAGAVPVHARGSPDRKKGSAGR
jgi:hypothetical protein